MVYCRPRLKVQSNKMPDRVFSQNDIAEQFASQLLERLDYMTLVPRKILDLGCGVSSLPFKLAERYPDAVVFAVDIAQQRCHFSRQQWQHDNVHYLCADMENLPFKNAEFDLIISNLAAYWACDVPRCFSQWQRCLKPEGALLFSTLGPDSLTELRYAFSQLDDHPHVNLFLDMHDLGDQLIHAGFADPVMDVQTIDLIYSSPQKLFAELRQLGESNVHTDRNLCYFGKRKYQKLLQLLAEFKNQQGNYRNSLELVFGNAWGKEVRERHQSKDASGAVTVSLDMLRDWKSQ